MLKLKSPSFSPAKSFCLNPERCAKPIFFPRFFCFNPTIVRLKLVHPSTIINWNFYLHFYLTTFINPNPRLLRSPKPVSKPNWRAFCFFAVKCIERVSMFFRLFFLLMVLGVFKAILLFPPLRRGLRLKPVF